MFLMKPFEQCRPIWSLCITIHENTSHHCLQLRVTAARPGTVNFELDIQKEHTVCISRSLRAQLLFDGFSRPWFEQYMIAWTHRLIFLLSEPPEYPPWRYYCKHGYLTEAPVHRILLLTDCSFKWTLEVPWPLLLAVYSRPACPLTWMVSVPAPQRFSRRMRLSLA